MTHRLSEQRKDFVELEQRCKELERELNRSYELRNTEMYRFKHSLKSSVNEILKSPPIGSPPKKNSGYLDRNRNPNKRSPEVRYKVALLEDADNDIDYRKGYEELLGICEDLVIEKENLEQQQQKLQDELSSLTPEFWEEIEDLKYNYSEALSLVDSYELLLKKVSAKRKHSNSRGRETVTEE